MLFELILLSLTNVIAVVVGLIALFASTVPVRLRLTLMATVLSLAIWQTVVYVSNHAATDLLFWNNFAFVWPTLGVFSFVLFMRFLTTHKKWKPRQVIISEVLPGFFMALGTAMQLVALVFWRIYELDAAGMPVRGESYGIYLSGMIVSLLSVMAILLVSVVTTRNSPGQHKAVLIVFYTVVLAIMYGLVFNVLLPVVTQTQDYAAFGILTTDIFAIGFAYSIATGKLLNVKLYAVRTVAYVLSIATLAAVYGALALTVSALFTGYETSPMQGLVNIGLALLLAFIFQPVKRFFDRITNRVFYRDNYDSDAFYAELNRELTMTNDLHELLGRVARYVAQTLKAEQGFFFIYREGRPIVSGTDKHSLFPTDDAHELDEYFRTHVSLIAMPQLSPKEASVRRMMLSHRIWVALPLRREDKVIGYLFLGEQKRGGYTRRDIRLLQTIADELVIAVQNALSVQAIKELNDHLEQRIAAATKELRASNAQLQRLDEAKDEFISMASHQLRTPLTSIKGYISMLLEGDAGAVSIEQKHLLREAFISSERMVRLIGDFLNVSRLQTGKFIIDKQPADLAKVVAREIESLEPNASARGLRFIYKKPTKFPQLKLDENKIQQVIMNFADNAIYYSKENSTITVSLVADKKGVEFTVKDSGIGVPQKEQHELFNKFFRATNARQQRPDGTGVGLFLAKKVIDAHGGRIIFESVEGKGSTFGFRLPIR